MGIQPELGFKTPPARSRGVLFGRPGTLSGRACGFPLDIC